MMELYLWTAAGVLISFVLPPLLRAAGIAGAKDPAASVDSFGEKVKSILTSRAVVITVLSLILALIVVAVLGDQITTWTIALVSGLGWQSLLARTLAPGS